MRPVRRGPSPQAHDFADYRDAFPFLVSRIGGYCCFCERKVVTQLAVEHIQPKGLAQYAGLVGRWENFLLACVNCNSTKGDKDVNPAIVLLPDRDNTVVAYVYEKDGSVHPASAVASVQAMAARTLALVGLDKALSEYHDENGKLIAIDRVSQRLEAWLLAMDAKADVDANPGNVAVIRGAIRTARENGFFSVWMAAFEGDANVRRRLIEAFSGTRESGCFNTGSTALTPGPNLDGLPNGGKV